jgi:putative transposase
MEAWKSAENEGFEALTAPSDVVASLMRPQQVRKTHRSEVKINSGVYFLDELRDFHGEEIRVAWDYRDVGAVGIYTLEGEWIGEAILDGNATPAMPQSMMERAGEKREKGQISRMVKKAKTLTGGEFELRRIESDRPTVRNDRQLEEARVYAKQLANDEPKFQIPQDKVGRYREWKRLDARVQAGEALSVDAQRWHENYCNHSDFKAIAKVMDPEMDASGQQPTRTRRAV